MFWGLVVEPGKRYEQTVRKSFHISMACLEPNEVDNSNVPLLLDIDSQEYILCTLHKNKIPQAQLDLNFQTGDTIAFFSCGKSKVHLTGYLINDDFDMSEAEDEEDEMEEEEMNGEETPKQVKNAAGMKRKMPTPNKLQKTKKMKEVEEEDEDSDDALDESGLEEEEDDMLEEDDDEDDDDDEEDEDEDEESSEGQEKSPQIKNKANVSKSPGGLEQKQKIKPEKQMATPKSEQNGIPQAQSSKKKMQGNVQAQKPETPKQVPQVKNTPKGTPEGTPQKKTIQGGVVIEDLKVGTGPVAKAGRQVTVYYVGRLKQNNKQFDAATQGPGFKFMLGRGEVIKGWDVGVAGMKLGGKRRIICPPHMAYGKKGQPPAIPPSSHLVFDVEVKGVN